MHTRQYKGFQTDWNNGVMSNGMAAIQRCILLGVLNCMSAKSLYNEPPQDC